MKELTEELKLEFQNYDQDELNNAFIEACRNGDLDIIQYLLASPELQEHADINAQHNRGFRWVCEKGHLEVVRYLLTSPELKNRVDIHAYDDEGFRWACNNGHLDVVRYLLTSPELNDHADIHAQYDRGFRWACQEGHLEIVRYLLTSPELQEHANIHAENDLGFQWACQEGHLEIICYLLTFFGEDYIEFQKKEYNLEWAISEKCHDIIKAMTFSLYKNDRFAYIENIPKVEEHCLNHGLDFKSWQEAMINEDVDINSHTTELFL